MRPAFVPKFSRRRRQVRPKLRILQALRIGKRGILLRQKGNQKNILIRTDTARRASAQEVAQDFDGAYGLRHEAHGNSEHRRRYLRAKRHPGTHIHHLRPPRISRQFGGGDEGKPRPRQLPPKNKQLAPTPKDQTSAAIRQYDLGIPARGVQGRQPLFPRRQRQTKRNRKNRHHKALRQPYERKQPLVSGRFLQSVAQRRRKGGR